MRFVVHTSVLNCDDSVLSLVDRLVDRLADEVHQVEIPDVDYLQESSWFEKARATRKKVLMSAVAKPPRRLEGSRGPHARALVVLDADSARMADKLAHTPLVILVEDRESDGVLLDILVETLGWPELQTLWTNGRQVTPRAMEIDTAGGKGAIPQRVQRIVSDAAEERRHHRLFVLCDSDSKWPGDGGAATAVINVCSAHGVPYHILRKRCAENYIPDRVIEATRDDPHYSNHASRFNALLRLSRAQRDHFPIKDGLTPKERSEALQAELYSTSDEEDLALLESGLFPKKPRPMQRLYQERRPSFTADGLRERDGQDELDELLHAIAREL